MTDHLAAVRAAIISAVPEILELNFGCVIRHHDGRTAVVYERAGYGQGSDWKIYTTPHHVFYFDAVDGVRLRENSSDKKQWTILGRKITLADVLRAIGKTKHHLIAVEAGTGAFMRWETDDCGRYDDNVGVSWPLDHDDLNFASPECLAYLHGLLV